MTAGGTVVLYEGTPGIRLHRPGLTVVGAMAADLADVASHHAQRGADRIELCGGLSTIDAAEVRARVGNAARVGLNRYGFESLEAAAGYKRAFEAGDVRPAAFLIPSAGPSDLAPVEHVDASLRPVTDLAHAERLGVSLAREGVGVVELYAGLGTAHAAAVLRGAEGAVPVGFVGYDD